MLNLGFNIELGGAGGAGGGGGGTQQQFYNKLAIAKMTPEILSIYGTMGRVVSPTRYPKFWTDVLTPLGEMRWERDANAFFIQCAFTAFLRRRAHKITKLGT